MKSAGILTFHWADNYGAILQTYALQQYLRDNGQLNVEVIDFSAPELIQRNDIYKQVKATKNPVRKVKLLYRTLIKRSFLMERHHKFEKFRHDYIRLSKRKYRTENDFLDSIPDYDIYVTGSDQVFNPKFNYTNVYYLNFPKREKRKIAYAPSFGFSGFNEALTQKITRKIGDYDFLSCREKEGAEYLSTITGRRIPNVLDPTFLLEKKDWESVMIRPTNNDEYIFVYDLAGGYNLIKIAKQLQEVTGFRIICCSTSLQNKYSGCETEFDIGPREFLGLINNAEYVVTDSFHGTALSLILGTKIISFIANKKVSSRITSLLGQLGLDAQICYAPTDFQSNLIVFKDYSQKLNELIDYSKQYLNTAIS